MHYLLYQLSTVQADLLPPEALDATEQQAYARRGQRYLLIRTLLKRELARLTGKAAEDIRFTYTSTGKPEYDPYPFNISHSGDLLCLAFHHSPPGVDIERIRERAHLASLAHRIMCPQQLSAWQQRRCPTGEFYDCWCAAEALTKQCGSTIWQAQQRPFLWSHGRIEPLYEHAPHIELFEPAAGYKGAMAYDS